jgi:peptide/nickel transport system permease protein
VNELRSDFITKIALYFLLLFFFFGIFGPFLAPYDPRIGHYAETGQLQRLEAPSLQHPLGTNQVGQDILSRMLVGAQATFLTALVCGTFIVVIGSVIGITSGYLGGIVDDLLMRFTDIVYSIPLLPAAIVLVGLIRGGFFATLVVLGLLLWRSMARVVRSQVLEIRERPYVLAAKSTGASQWRIMLKHIFPNVAPMIILFSAIGAGYAIIIQAGLAFLGISNPFVPSWGVILRNAFDSGAIASAWWWSLPPGFLISFTVLSTFLLGRGYEAEPYTD